MPQLSEYEISQISEAIKDLAADFSELANKVDPSGHREDFEKASSALREYSREEEKALKEAEKTIQKAMSSTGFFSTSGLTQILNKKTSESQKHVIDILNKFSDSISKIYSSLPRIGGEISDVVFESHGQESDLDFSDDDFSIERETESEGVFFPRGSASLTSEEVSYEDEPFNDSDLGKQGEPAVYETGCEEITTDPAKTVFQIGEFKDPGLKRIFCTGVEEIKANAFNGCSSLELVFLSKDIKKISHNAFRGINPDCVIAFEATEADVASALGDCGGLDGKKTVFCWNKNEPLPENIPAYSSTKAEDGGDGSQSKKIRITKNTHLDSDEVKQVFISRHLKYEFILDDIDKGIQMAGNDLDKDSIIYYALLQKRLRDLDEEDYFRYGCDLVYLIDLAKGRGLIDDAISMSLGHLFLASSGYLMYQKKYAASLTEPEHTYYSNRWLETLAELISAKGLTGYELADLYRNSTYVKELSQRFTKAYFDIDDSIRLMYMALKDPDKDFEIVSSGIARRR